MKWKSVVGGSRRGLWGVLLSLMLVGGVALVGQAPAGAAPGDLAFGVVTLDAGKDGAVTAGGPLGTQDRPVAGVGITLKGSDPNHPGWTTTTDASGHWSFPDTLDTSMSPGPFTVTVRANGVNGNNYLTTPGNIPGVNDFTRDPAATPQLATSAEFDASGGPVELNALLYPTWSTDIIAAGDPDGYDENSIFTGTTPFDDNDTEPGFDANKSNDRVRNGDLVTFNWSMTANAEQDLDSSFDGWFEQTLDLGPGAVATFGPLSSECKAGSSVTAIFPGGTKVLAANEQPPAGTTSVVLRCHVGQMGEVGGTNRIIDTSILVGSTSANNATFTTSVRTYGTTADGTPTARPDGPTQFGPFTTVSAPRYDILKQRPWTWSMGTKKINGVDTVGFEVGYNIAITTDRRTGSEPFKQPLVFEDSVWANTSDSAHSLLPGVKWYMTGCAPEGGGNNSVGPGQSTVYGKIGIAQINGGLSTAANSVVDSGSCAYSRVGNADTGNYQITLTGIDTSGSSYPSVSNNGTALPSNKFYVASYFMKVFIPASEIDAAVAPAGDNKGSLDLWNRVGDFEPVGASGASNYGSGFEPGYCDPGPSGDRNTNCDLIPRDPSNPNGAKDPSNNVSGPATIAISPGVWSKAIVDSGRTWSYRNGPLPESGGIGDGSGQVQPGQTYTSGVNQRINFDTTGMQMCDVFDSTVMRLSELRNDPTATPDNGDIAYPNPPGMYVAVTTTPVNGGEPNRSQMLAFQSNWTTRYAHVDLTGDNPNTGVFNTLDSRYEGDWTKQKAAASGSAIACGSPNVTWYDSPQQVPGGIDGVNAVWTVAKPGYVQPGLTTVNWIMGLEQRESYNGGPHAGQTIPERTIAANFANVKNSTYGDWQQTNGYIPGAGKTAGGTHNGENTSWNGDRWTLVRARMAITKHTVAGTVAGVPAEGVAEVNVAGTAEAGKPIIWQVDASLSAAAAQPAPVHDVVITDTLPSGAIYDPAATAAQPGGTPANSYTVNPNGTTTLVWNLGTLTPNQPIAPLKIVTYADTLLPKDFELVNRVNIKAKEIPPVAANHNDLHTVKVTQSGNLQLKKSVDQPLDLTDDTQAYTLQIRNFSETLRIQSPTVIDVLPYNNDSTNGANVNRNPGSDYSGTNRLMGPPTAFEFNGTTSMPGKFYYTTATPGSVSQDLNADNPAIWSETFTQDATAFKFVAERDLENISTGSRSGLTIKFATKQTGNAAGDLYANRFTAFSRTLYNNGRYQLLTSNQVLVRVLGFSLGDLIWIDRNNNGKFDGAPDQTVPQGVKVDVYDEADNLVASTTTNQRGRWVVNDLPQGKYYAVVPASEFAVGGPLHRLVPQTVGYSATPDNDVNEAGDHNGSGPAGGPMRTQLITLSATTSNPPAVTGNEPIDDNTGNMPVSPGTTDAFTNFTLDMALRANPGYEFTKTSVPVTGTAVKAGGTIAYTLTGRNTGMTPLDVEITDDLSKVLDHATMEVAPQASIAGESSVPGVQLTGTDLLWEGTLKPGQSVVVTYTVKVKADAAGATIENLAGSTATPPADPPITPPDVVTEHPVPGYDFGKTSVPRAGTAVKAGGTIAYTLTGRNTGATELDAEITDDLSKVLNHATMTTQPVARIGGVVTNPPVVLTGTDLSWSGTLQPGESVVITYTVTVNTNQVGATIENSADSDATPPGLPPIDPPPVVLEHPIPAYVFTKSADPADGSAVAPGGLIEYTLTGENTGATVLDPVEVTDDLSKVLDNAVMVDEPVATIGGSAASVQPVRNGNDVSWSGSLQPGQSVVITYSVRVKAGAAGAVINNVADSEATPPGLPPIDPPPVETEHPVPGYEFTKSADPADGSAVAPGGLIEYTLTGENTGATVLDPVEVTDDLSKVLDNAVMVDEPVATIGGSAAAVQPVRNGNDVSWSGSLQPGQSVVITYSVRVKAGTAGAVINNVADSEATPPGLPPIDPPPVETEHPVPGYEFTKVSDPVSGSLVVPNGTITYTLTGTNTGATVLDPVTVTDDLSKVLAHARITTAPVATVAGATGVPQPSLSGTNLTWSGTLRPGQSVVITYTVTLAADAEGVLVSNHAQSSATPPGLPPITPPYVETTHPTPGYTFAKSAVPATGSVVRPGDVITYTLTGNNFGRTDLAPVVITDDLTNVLAFASLEGQPSARILKGGATRAATSPTVVGNQLTWQGPLAEGEKVEVTYAVKVKEGTEGRIVRNVAHSSATPPGKPPITPPEVSTEHPVPGYELAKTSDPGSGSEVERGETIAYKVTGTNTGATVLDPVVITDDLSEVLTHAALVGEPEAVITAGGVTSAAARPTVRGTTLTWRGSLKVGEQVVVTYRVRVDDDAPAARLRNVATSTASPPTGPGLTPEPGETVHEVVEPPKSNEDDDDETHHGGGDDGDDGSGGFLPGTGSPASPGVLALAGLAVVTGAGLLVGARRRRRDA